MIERLLEDYYIKKKVIDNDMANIISTDNKVLAKYYRMICTKIINFKKTREEMIKFIIRRAWKKSNTEDGRDNYYSEYRSMNANYLKKIFDDH